MILGILRETKKGENRVICTPKEVETITTAGHTVYAQRGCGARAGFPDEAYEAAGALLASTAQEVFAVCDAPFSYDPTLDKTLAAESGYRITRHRLIFEGVCPACQKAEREK